MAITFTQEKKKQKYLLLILGLFVVLILLVIWWGFFKEEKVSLPVSPSFFAPPKVEINLEVLKSPELEEFYPFEQILPFEGEIGRENPFIPY